MSSTAPVLETLSLPLRWEDFDLPNPLATSETTIATGDIGWRWRPEPPALGIPDCPAAAGREAAGWDLDHVVVLVPDLADAIDRFAAIGVSPRLTMRVRGRPTAFFRAGPVVEVIESPVRAPSLFGIALVTEEPLETVVLRWRTLGLDVSDPRPAIQQGRRIFTVRNVEAGLAVMSPDRSTA